MKLIAKWMLAAAFALPMAASSASACPLCREAIDANDPGSDHDPERLARAYNYTIYGFLVTPALLLSGLGLMIYRSYRNAPPAKPE